MLCSQSPSHLVCCSVFVVGANRDVAPVKSAFRFGALFHDASKFVKQGFLVNLQGSEEDAILTLYCSSVEKNHRAALTQIQEVANKLQAVCNTGFRGYSHTVEWNDPNDASQQDQNISKLFEELKEHITEEHNLTRSVVKDVHQDILTAIESTSLKIACPSSFIILPFVFGSQDVSTKDHLHQLQDNFHCIMDLVNNRAIDAIMGGPKQRMYLYLIDEVKGDLVKGDGFPIVLEKSALSDLLKNHCDLLKSGLQIVAGINNLTGLASMFFPTLPIPHLDPKVIKDFTKSIESLREVPIVMEHGAAGEEVKLRNRGELGDFKQFLLENGVNVERRCGLNPILIKKQQQGLQVGEVVWTKFETSQEVENYYASCEAENSRLEKLVQSGEAEEKQEVEEKEELQAKSPSEPVAPQKSNTPPVNDTQQPQPTPDGCCVIS